MSSYAFIPRRFKILLMRVAGPFLYSYWLVVRPKTSGSKVVLVQSSSVYLVRHSYGGSGWSLPGGQKERGETYEETAVREVREELGVTLREVHYCGECYFTHHFKRDTVHVYSAEPVGEPLIDCVELLEGRWFPVSALPVVTRSTRAMLDKFFATTYTQ